MAPEYVSVEEYVRSTQEGRAYSAARITPPRLAEMLERDNHEALRLVEKVDVSGNASLMYEVADVKAWANLGLHLAEKLKGAVALQTYRMAGGEQNKQRAVEHLTRAVQYWDEVVKITRPIYKGMPLTHYNHNGFVANDDNLFHWALIRDEVAADVEIAKRAVAAN